MTIQEMIESKVQEFDAKKEDLKGWLYGTVHKQYDTEETADTVQKDVDDHLKNEWLRTTLTSLAIEVLKTAQGDIEQQASDFMNAQITVYDAGQGEKTAAWNTALSQCAAKLKALSKDLSRKQGELLAKK